jgi:hypothetical protein
MCRPPTGVAEQVADALVALLVGDLDGRDALLHRGRRVDLRAGERVDQEQLLLDAHRERRTGAEGVLGWVVRGGDACAYPLA